MARINIGTSDSSGDSGSSTSGTSESGFGRDELRELRDEREQQDTDDGDSGGETTTDRFSGARRGRDVFRDTGGSSGGGGGSDGTPTGGGGGGTGGGGGGTSVNVGPTNQELAIPGQLRDPFGGGGRGRDTGTGGGDRSGGGSPPGAGPGFGGGTGSGIFTQQRQEFEREVERERTRAEEQERTASEARRDPEAMRDLQGIETDAGGTLGALALEFEGDIADEYGVSREGIRIVRDGDRLRAEFNAIGLEELGANPTDEEVAEQVSAEQGIPVSDVDVFRGPGQQFQLMFGSIPDTEATDMAAVGALKEDVATVPGIDSEAMDFQAVEAVREDRATVPGLDAPTADELAVDAVKADREPTAITESVFGPTPLGPGGRPLPVDGSASAGPSDASLYGDVLAPFGGAGLGVADFAIDATFSGEWGERLSPVGGDDVEITSPALNQPGLSEAALESSINASPFGVPFRVLEGMGAGDAVTAAELVIGGDTEGAQDVVESRAETLFTDPFGTVAAGTADAYATDTDAPLFIDEEPGELNRDAAESLFGGPGLFEESGDASGFFTETEESLRETAQERREFFGVGEEFGAAVPETDIFGFDASGFAAGLGDVPGDVAATPQSILLGADMATEIAANVPGTVEEFGAAETAATGLELGGRAFQGVIEQAEQNPSRFAGNIFGGFAAGFGAGRLIQGAPSTARGAYIRARGGQIVDFEDLSDPPTTTGGGLPGFTRAAQADPDVARREFLDQAEGNVLAGDAPVAFHGRSPGAVREFGGFGRRFEAPEGTSELPGLFQSADLSQLRVGGSGESGGLNIGLPRPDLTGSRVLAERDVDVDIIPGNRRGAGYGVDIDEGILVGDDGPMGRAQANALAEQFGGERITDPTTGGYQFLTEEADPGQSFVRAAGEISPEQEAIAPPGATFADSGGLFGVRTGGTTIPFTDRRIGGTITTGRLTERVDPDAPGGLFGAGDTRTLTEVAEETSRAVTESRRIAATQPEAPYFPVGFGGTGGSTSPFGTTTTPTPTATAPTTGTRGGGATATTPFGSFDLSGGLFGETSTTDPTATRTPTTPGTGTGTGTPDDVVSIFGGPTSPTPTGPGPTSGSPTGGPTSGGPTPTGAPTSPPNSPPSSPPSSTPFGPPGGPPGSPPFLPPPFTAPPGSGRPDRDRDRTDRDDDPFWAVPPAFQEFENPVVSGRQFLGLGSTQGGSADAGADGAGGLFSGAFDADGADAQDGGLFTGDTDLGPFGGY